MSYKNSAPRSRSQSSSQVTFLEGDDTITAPISSHSQSNKIGVVLVNLGTPDGADFWSVRRYLKEFLSDGRVIDVNPLLWKLILHLFILPFRTSKTVEIYKNVWRQDTNDSPLRYYTQQQAEKLAQKFSGKGIEVAYAMRYGNPSLKDVLKHLQEKGCGRLIVLPLYPQYSNTTTASVQDEVSRCLREMCWEPTLRIAPPYEGHHSYITALKKSMETHLETLGWVPEKILVSFHGIPLDYVDKGDPYRDFCERTFQLLRDAMPPGMPPLELTYQSRFGPREWLQPYTHQTLERRGREGIQKLALIAPGFAVDCIETLEELQIKGKKIFEDNGGTHFTQIPCLNDSDDAIDLLETLTKESMAGWDYSRSKSI